MRSGIVTARSICAVLLFTTLQAFAGDPGPTTTTTTMPEPLCGDANGDEKITAADALIALRTAVGSASCPVSVCDYTGDDKVAASDALAILRRAVGQSVTANCPFVPTTPLTWDEGTWGQVLWN
jgi:hypothetical protein